MKKLYRVTKEVNISTMVGGHNLINKDYHILALNASHAVDRSKEYAGELISVVLVARDIIE